MKLKKLHQRLHVMTEQKRGELAVAKLFSPHRVESLSDELAKLEGQLNRLEACM
jgi:hypothetical protein